MTLREKYLLWFHKKQCLDVEMVKENRVSVQVVVKLNKDGKSFTFDEGTYYVIATKLVKGRFGLYKGYYYYGNSEQGNPLTWTQDGQLTPQQMNKLLNNDFIEKIATSTRGKETQNNNMMYIMLGGFGLIAVGLYLIFDMVSQLGLQITEIMPIIDYIREQIATGGM